MEECIGEVVPAHAVWFPWTPGYNNQTTLETLYIKNSPRALAYARDENDVVALLKCATDAGIKVTIRCGGHSNAGSSTMDGALCIDISWMNETIVKGDKATIQAGSTAGAAVYHVFTQSNGTRGVPVGEKPGVGFAGLILGGGFGFSSKHDGLLCDRLVSMRAVTLAGEKIDISPEKHADLFWASCGGGGGNFVVVTGFTIKTTDVSMGVVSYRCPLKANVDLVHFLDWYQGWAMNEAHRMSPNIKLSGNTTLIVGMFRGSLTEFKEMLRDTLNDETYPVRITDFRSDGVDPCVVEEDFIHAVMGLSGWASRTDPIEVLLERFPERRSHYKFKSWFLYEPLSRDALRLLLDTRHMAETGTGHFSFEFQQLGGTSSAVTAVDPYATAYIHRKADFCVMLFAHSDTKEETDRLAATMRKVYFEISKNLTWRAAYGNHLDTDLGQIEHEQLVFSVLSNRGGKSSIDIDGSRTIERLASIRQKYNPMGSLANIQPTGVYGLHRDDHTQHLLVAIIVALVLGGLACIVAGGVVCRACAARLCSQRNPAVQCNSKTGCVMGNV